MLKLKFGALFVGCVSFAGLALADGTPPAQPAGQLPPYRVTQPAGQLPPYRTWVAVPAHGMVISAPSD